MSAKPIIDLQGAEYARDPLPAYATMRETCPVYANIEPGWMNPERVGPVWYVSRYDDARELLLDTKRFVKDYKLAFSADELAQMPPMTGVWELASESLINKEAPHHSRLRGLVNKAFTPRIVETLRHRVQAIADELFELEDLSAFGVQGDSERRDIIRRIQMADDALDAEGHVDFYAKSQFDKVQASIRA